MGGCEKQSSFRSGAEGKFVPAMFRRKFLGKVLPAVSGGTTGRRLHTSRRRAAGRSFRQSRQRREEQCSLCVKRRCSKSVRCVSADNFPQKTIENLQYSCKAKPRTELSGVLCVLGRYFPLTRRIHGSCRVPQRGEGRRADLCPAACSRGERGDEQTSALLRGEKGESVRSVPCVGV